MQKITVIVRHDDFNDVEATMEAARVVNTPLIVKNIWGGVIISIENHMAGKIKVVGQVEPKMTKNGHSVQLFKRAVCNAFYNHDWHVVAQI